MNLNLTPPIRLPEQLSDEAAAQLLEFLHQLAYLLESHYAAQLHRYYQRGDDRQRDLWDDLP